MGWNTRSTSAYRFKSALRPHVGCSSCVFRVLLDRFVGEAFFLPLERDTEHNMSYGLLKWPKTFRYSEHRLHFHLSGRRKELLIGRKLPSAALLRCFTER